MVDTATSSVVKPTSSLVFHEYEASQVQLDKIPKILPRLDSGSKLNLTQKSFNESTSYQKIRRRVSLQPRLNPLLATARPREDMSTNAIPIPPPQQPPIETASTSRRKEMLDVGRHPLLAGHRTRYTQFESRCLANGSSSSGMSTSRLGRSMSLQNSLRDNKNKPNQLNLFPAVRAQPEPIVTQRLNRSHKFQSLRRDSQDLDAVNMYDIQMQQEDAKEREQRLEDLDKLYVTPRNVKCHFHVPPTKIHLKKYSNVSPATNDKYRISRL